MKNLFLFALLLCFSISLNAQQQWEGSSSSAGTIYRTGRVGINTNNPLSFFHIFNNNYNLLSDGNSITYNTPTNGSSYIRAC